MEVSEVSIATNPWNGTLGRGHWCLHERMSAEAEITTRTGFS